jgi:hypothetical protein
LVILVRLFQTPKEEKIEYVMANLSRGTRGIGFSLSGLDFCENYQSQNKTG